MIKLMIVGRRRPGTTLAQHRRHIRETHGELVLRYIAEDTEYAPRRYVQNPVLDGSFRATNPGGDPFALQRDFVTQIWFDGVDAIARSRQRPFYLEHLKDDEDNFVDQASVVMLPVAERVLLAGEPAPDACKLFVFHGRAPGVEAEVFRAAWSSEGSKLADSVQFRAGVTRYVQNDVCPGPTPHHGVDGIDEFWTKDEASLSALADGIERWVRESLGASGICASGLNFHLMVREDVLFAGARAGC